MSGRLPSAGSARLRALVTVVAVGLGFFVAMVAGDAAADASPAQGALVNAVPAAYTPNINNGTVYAIAKVGNTVVVGGSFTSATDRAGTTAVTRNRILAFDATTGTLSTSFAPSLDGTVNALIPGPTAGTVYVGGAFTNVGTTKSKNLALLDVTTGALVSGFKSPSPNGAVQDLRSTSGHLLVAGSFTTAGGLSRQGLMSLNPSTGAVDGWTTVALTGHHNYNGSGASGPVGGRALDVSPDGTRAVVVGNFKNADGVQHDQVVMLDLSAASAVVDTNWNTLQYTAACASGAFDTYVEDVDFSPDGSYFAIASTGGGTFSANSDGSRGLCDSATRWETTDTGSNVKPTWVDYTGNDTFWSVAATGTAIYVGGHQRWVNNPQGGDSAGPGAVPRPGIVALDPANGLPFSWNPGRNPRGAGAYALLATSTGLYVGSDTAYIGNYRYNRARIAYFPLAGGSTPPSTATAQLPANVYTAGSLPNAANSGVLYRVNAAGPAVAATDNGPDWMADQTSSDPGAAFHNASNNAAGFGCCATLSSSVPASTPASIFDTERWDGGSKGDGDEMRWTFPVAAGTRVGVRLYFANRYSGTSRPGQRVFDVAINGATVLDHYDITADAGDQVGTMKQFDVTSPASGSITIDWTHEIENPNVDGIELVDLAGPSANAPSTKDLSWRPVSGARVGDSTVVANTGVDWSTTRGAFAVGNTLYWGTADGNLYRAPLTGTTVGTPVAVDPYNDPAWSSVATGSGQTYKGARPGYYGELASITGQFYSRGRIYYTLAGQSALYWRWFQPESGVVGQVENTVGGANFASVAGLTLSGDTIYYANRGDGTLHSLSFANATPDGTTDAVVSTPGVDWRSRGLFLYGNATFPNQPPTASATASCTGLGCRFDASASHDDDGSIASYRWDFGDGTSATGAQVGHGYATAGDKTVTLTVTDDRGATATWTGTASPDASGPAVRFVGDTDWTGQSNAPAVAVPAGVNDGDTELLFVSVNTAGVTGTPTGLSGWTQIAKVTNSTLETTVFRRGAQAADAGATVTVPLTATSRADVQLAVYSGVSADALTPRTTTDAASATHAAPAADVTVPGSWVLSYWTDRSSTTTAWTLPASVTQRQIGVGTGTSRVSGALADSGGAVVTGTYPAQTASTNASSRATDLTLVLAPAS